MKKKSQKRRSWLRLAMVTTTAVIAALVVAEMYLRKKETYIIEQKAHRLNFNLFVDRSPELFIHYTPRGRRLIPNTKVIIKNHALSDTDIRMEINSLGFRDAEIPPDKKPNETRILVLGDSITWGDYLQAEEVYVERAESYLRKAFPEQTIEVINAGVGDIGLTEMIDILSERGISLKPDIVVCAVYLNDTRPPWGFPGEIANRGWLRRKSLLAEKLYKSFKLQHWIKHKGSDRFAWIQQLKILHWLDERKDFLHLAHYARYDWGAAWENDFSSLIEQQFSHLRSLADRHGFKVLIMAFPVAFQVHAKFNENSPQQNLQHEAAKAGFQYLDLLPLLRSNQKSNLFFDHCHPRKETNDLIGKELADFLAKKMLAQRSNPHTP